MHRKAMQNISIAGFADEEFAGSSRKVLPLLIQHANVTSNCIYSLKKFNERIQSMLDYLGIICSHRLMDNYLFILKLSFKWRCSCLMLTNFCKIRFIFSPFFHSGVRAIYWRAHPIQRDTKENKKSKEKENWYHLYPLLEINENRKII